MFRCAGQAGGGPLMSNVRPHVNTNSVNPFFGVSRCVAAEFDRLHQVASTLLQAALPSSVLVRSGGATSKPRIQMTVRRSLSASSLFAKLAQAARPPAGGSPLSVLREEQELEILRLRFALAVWSRKARAAAKRRVTFGAAACASPLTHAATSDVRPNPSLEWTCTGMALGPRGYSGHHPPRGPSATPAHAPQLKR